MAGVAQDCGPLRRPTPEPLTRPEPPIQRPAPPSVHSVLSASWSCCIGDHWACACVLLTCQAPPISPRSTCSDCGTATPNATPPPAYLAAATAQSLSTPSSSRCQHIVGTSGQASESSVALGGATDALHSAAGATLQSSRTVYSQPPVDHSRPSERLHGVRPSAAAGALPSPHHHGSTNASHEHEHLTHGAPPD